MNAGTRMTVPTVDASQRPPGLATVDDVSRAAVDERDRRRLQKLLDAVASHRPVWWRRNGFHQAPHADAEPKWHLFAGRTRSDDPERRWHFTWSALCGYRYVHLEIISGMPRFKVTSPKKDDRCKKCTAALQALSDSRAAPTG